MKDESKREMPWPYGKFTAWSVWEVFCTLCHAGPFVAAAIWPAWFGVWNRLLLAIAAGYVVLLWIAEARGTTWMRLAMMDSEIVNKALRMTERAQALADQTKQVVERGAKRTEKR